MNAGMYMYIMFVLGGGGGGGGREDSEGSNIPPPPPLINYILHKLTFFIQKTQSILRWMYVTCM